MGIIISVIIPVAHDDFCGQISSMSAQNSEAVVEAVTETATAIVEAAKETVETITETVSSVAPPAPAGNSRKWLWAGILILSVGFYLRLVAKNREVANG